jgi:hypothetical protein
MEKQKKQLKSSTIAKLAKICIFSRPSPKIFVDSLTKCNSFHSNITSKVHFFSLKHHQRSTTLFTQTSPAKYNSFHSNITSKVQLFLFKIAKKFCGGCLAVPARFTIFALESSEKCCPTTQNQTL